MKEAKHDKLKALREEIQKGLDDLEAGRYRDGVMAEFRDRLLKMKAEKLASSKTPTQKTAVDRRFDTF